MLRRSWTAANDIPVSAGLVLHVAGSPHERGALDHLPAAGTAVLRCYREGELFFVDPLAVEPQDPASYDAHCALEAARALETSGSAIRAAAVVKLVHDAEYGPGARAAWARLCAQQY